MVILNWRLKRREQKIKKQIHSLITIKKKQMAIDLFFLKLFKKFFVPYTAPVKVKRKA